MKKINRAYAYTSVPQKFYEENAKREKEKYTNIKTSQIRLLFKFVLILELEHTHCAKDQMGRVNLRPHNAILCN